MKQHTIKYQYNRKKMKYRIKITTFQSGRQEFEAHVKGWFFWTTLDYQGNTCTHESKTDIRENALKRIDLHIKGNCKPKTIEFEYINI